MAGGFIGTAVAAVCSASYEAAPVLRTLLTLSEGQPADEADLTLTPAANSARAPQPGHPFRGARPPGGVRFARRVRRTTGCWLQLIDADSSGRELYEILEAAAQ